MATELAENLGTRAMPKALSASPATTLCLRLAIAIATALLCQCDLGGQTPWQVVRVLDGDTVDIVTREDWCEFACAP